MSVNTKRLTLSDIIDIKNARYVDPNVQYLLELPNTRKHAWTPHPEIASQTRQSQSFNDWIKDCEMIPPRFRSHKELKVYAENMAAKYIAFSLEVYVNKEMSSMIMFPVEYDFCYFAGIKVSSIVKVILKKYKDRFDYLPIRPNGIFKNISEVCFVSFKYVLNCRQKT